MNNFKLKVKDYTDAEEMAADYLAAYFGNNQIKYPISPFKMLKDEKVPFILRNFNKLEGAYIPAHSIDDIAIIAINAKRPITRQRFTAAHELCHHLRDSDKQINCPIGQKNAAERFADNFASALLMPIGELRSKVNEYKDASGKINLDSVLLIADYFGVSFEACVYRIAYKIHAIAGDTSPDELKKRIKKYQPNKARMAKGLTYANIYADLIDNYANSLSFSPSDKSKYIFENEYVYNDSRMEGLDVSIEQASEIVTDLRLNAQNSKFCTEDNEPYMSVAGHYKMYQNIFQLPVKETLNVYDSFLLNKDLFAYYPNPDFGGNPRQNNVLVLGAKFETVDYNDIFTELSKVDMQIQEYFTKRKDITTSEYIKHVIRIHHQITVIHPFPEGNGRTARAFMNVQLIRAGLTPLYIKVEEKDIYLKALEIADTKNNYDPLYEVIFKVLLRSHVELNEYVEL